MSDTATLHQDQIAYWNGDGGRHWVEECRRTDRVMAPIAAAAVERAGARTGESVLDVGCGAGVTTAALAACVGKAGRVLGLDVSAPLVEAARARFGALGNLEFRLADAAAADLAGLGADLLFSRFGVMFFGDPTAAFANLRQALRPGGRVLFACWRTPRENGWMMKPVAAAYAHVPKLPEMGPEDPGPFSFADPVRVRHILEGAGFGDIAFEPVDLELDLAAGGGLAGAVHFATRIGAASRAISGQPEAAQQAAIRAIRDALAPFAEGGQVRLPAAIWLVTAKP